MKHTLTAALAATTFLASTATAGTISDVFTSYYAFGDSLTDDGKLPDAALHPLSDDGRFSTGPTYAEYVAAEFDGTGANTANLAIGGATGNNENYNVINVLSTFAGQIATFAASVSSGAPLPVRTSETDTVVPQATAPGTNPLVSVLFGGNDNFQSAARAAEKGITVQQVLEDAADAVADGIRAIAALAGGNLFDDFLVLTLPGGGNADIYNTQLALNLLQLQTEGLNIISYNTDAAFAEIITDTLTTGGATFGITDFLTPCTPTLSDPSGPTCATPDAFALTDAVHPNGVVQQVLGQRVISTLEAAAPVPLPAGGVLLLGGLGALVVARRRAA